MKLKDLVDEILIEPRKFTDYVLSPINPQGQHKALMFQKHLGYTKDNYQSLLAQIQAKALEAEAIPQQIDQYGQRYQVDLEVQGSQPHQREIVRTGWIIPPEANYARLLTAYVRRQP